MGSPAVLVALSVLCTALAGHGQVARAAAGVGAKPAFDWTQFIKGVKRAAETDAAMTDTQEVDIDYQDSQFQIKPLASNPMSPFLSMKPFLPMKPTFMPPVVDPQAFIDKKTALLNGLFSPMGPVGAKAMGPPPFGGMAANYFAGKKTAFLTSLFNQLATPPPQAVPNLANATQPAADANAIQRRLVAPWLTTPPPIVDPKTMTDKKTAFLDKLFSSFNAAAPGDGTPDTSTIVPPGFWMPLPPKPAVKPTIVPPDFWLPFPASKSADVPVKPVVDPSVLVDKKAKFLNDLMSSLDSAAPPAEPTYDDKVSAFLDKLLEALTTPTVGLKRALEPPSSAAPPLNAKDKLMDTFLGELTGIKNNMVDTVAQMLKTQKEAATVASPLGAKPGKKAGPPFGGLWGPMANLKPTPDPTIPFQQKIDVLNQVFDMLTSLQKDVATAVNEAGLPPTNMTPVKNATNTTILGLLRKKLMEMDDGTPSKYGVRDTSSGALQEPRAETRSIQMAVRQGYQSLPPGTAEVLQAGGGSSPQGKEGGGITLQKASSNRYNTWESRHHHHHD